MLVELRELKSAECLVDKMAALLEVESAGQMVEVMANHMVDASVELRVHLWAELRGTGLEKLMAVSSVFLLVVVKEKSLAV